MSKYFSEIPITLAIPKDNLAVPGKYLFAS